MKRQKGFNFEKWHAWILWEAEGWHLFGQGSIWFNSERDAVDAVEMFLATKAKLTIALPVGKTPKGYKCP